MSQFTDSLLYVYYDNAGVFTDFTAEAFSPDPLKIVSFALDVNKYLYLGKANTFNHRYFYFKTPVSGAALKIEYYYNSVWSTVTKVFDTTYNFSQSGFLDWELPEFETLVTVNSMEAYWIRISSTVAKSGFEAYTIKNLFSDDDMIKDYLPELDRYRPAGKTNFVYLHELAKSEMIADLKESGRIEYEDQLKNPLIPLQELSCYKFLELLLLPLCEDESIKFMFTQFASSYKKRLASTALSVDTNEDNVLTTGEINKITQANMGRV